MIARRFWHVWPTAEGRKSLGGRPLRSRSRLKSLNGTGAALSDLRDLRLAVETRSEPGHERFSARSIGGRVFSLSDPNERAKRCADGPQHTWRGVKPTSDMHAVTHLEAQLTLCKYAKLFCEIACAAKLLAEREGRNTQMADLLQRV